MGSRGHRTRPPTTAGHPGGGGQRHTKRRAAEEKPPVLGDVLYRGTPAPRPRATAVPPAADRPQSPHGRAAVASAPGKPLLGSARPSSPTLLRPRCGAAAADQAPRGGGLSPPGCAAEAEEEEGGRLRVPAQLRFLPGCGPPPPPPPPPPAPWAMGAAAGADAREGVAPPLDPGRSLPLPRGAGSPAASQDKLFLIKGAESLPPLPSLACTGQGRAAPAAGAPWLPPGRRRRRPAPGRKAFPCPPLAVARGLAPLSRPRGGAEAFGDGLGRGFRRQRGSPYNAARLFPPLQRRRRGLPPHSHPPPVRGRETGLQGTARAAPALLGGMRGARGRQPPRAGGEPPPSLAPGRGGKTAAGACGSSALWGCERRRAAVRAQPCPEGIGAVGKEAARTGWRARRGFLKAKFP